MKKKKEINNKLLKYIFYIVFVFCVLFAAFIYIRPFHSISVTASYDTSAKRIYTDFNGDINNYFVCDVDKFNSISLFLGKESNIKNIHVTLFDQDNNMIYEERFKDVGDMVVLNFPAIEDSFGKVYKLVLDSDDAFHVYTTLPKEDGNYIENFKDTTLIFTMSGYKDNYFYMWYPIMMIGMLLPFYIMIGGSKDVKKSR